MIFVAVVAAVLIGEAYVYTAGPGRYSSDIWVNDDGDLEYSLTSKGSEQYSIVVSDNGVFERIEKYYVYYDESYGSKLEKAWVPVGAKELTQEYYISQLITMLRGRGVCDIEVLNAAGLKEAMERDVTDGICGTKGLVVLSGALPDTVYEGNSADIIFDWIETGGSLYWAGNILGKYYATCDGRTTEVAGYGDLFFFGQPCVTDDTDKELSDIATNGYRHSLSLMNNSVRYGIDPSGFAAAHLTVGYTKDGYCSAALFERGNGMICVLAGDLSNDQRHDLAQIIASGLCPYSEPIGYVKGEVKRNTVTGIIEGMSFVSGINYTAYVYYGGYFTVYGKAEGWKE
jgi:hypothetical protein